MITTATVKIQGIFFELLIANYGVIVFGVPHSSFILLEELHGAGNFYLQMVG